MRGLPQHTSKESLAVVSFVCKGLGVDKDGFFSLERTKSLAEARQIVIHLIRKLFFKSYPTIANELGYKDHTSVLYADKKIERLCKSDKRWRGIVSRIEKTISSNRSFASRIKKAEEVRKTSKTPSWSYKRLRSVIGMGGVEDLDLLPKNVSERNKAVVTLLDGGMRLRGVGEELGVSLQRIQQIRDLALLWEARKFCEKNNFEKINVRDYISSRKKDFQEAALHVKRDKWRSNYVDKLLSRDDIRERILSLEENRD